MSGLGQRFCVLPGNYAVCRLERESGWPAWARGPFVSVISTEDETSIVCAADVVPPGVRAERGWRLLKLIGPFPLTAVGVLASVAAPLAQAGISLLAIATHDTDYLLVKAEMLDQAVAALCAAGHEQVGLAP